MSQPAGNAPVDTMLKMVSAFLVLSATVKPALLLHVSHSRLP